MNRDEGFVSRWARRKAQARSGTVADDPPPPAPQVEPPAVAPAVPVPTAPPASLAAQAEAAVDAPPPPPLPTLDDVAALASDAADFSRFVAPQVSAEVRNAAMKKMFTAPHFNLMDGLDVYIDDYSQPDPMPQSMLRSLVQSKVLGLFADDPPEAAPQGNVPTQLDAAAEVAPAPADDVDVAVEPPAPTDPAPPASA
jgi:Protein of unknown function (DUF3306)